MSVRLLIATAALSALMAGVATAPAQARGRAVSVQGSGGHGFTHSTAVDRTAGGVASTRSTQTNAGYGATTTRNASYGNGAYNSSSQTTFNNGQSIDRSVSAQANGDGTASYEASRTGVNGVTHGVSGTVTRTGPQ
ncbi:hypothetical protein ACO2Q3_26720 [Caulobacter sp. KR2-114]|uniref:hypothetical protein n=1 Tax=Caulobacter sp. KR2-114 TaxID=3400912 RepID=UPI003C0877BB